MAGNVLGTTSNPAAAGLPGVQPGDPTAGPAGVAISSLTDAFSKGLKGPQLPGMGGDAAEGAAGGEAAGGLAELAPLAAL